MCYPISSATAPVSVDGAGRRRISGELQQAFEKLDPLPGHVADLARSGPC